MATQITLDNLVVSLSRSQEDNRLIVDIDSSQVAENDQHPNGVPNIVIYVNDGRLELRSDGSVYDVEEEE